MNSQEVRLKNTTAQSLIKYGNGKVSGKVLDINCGDKRYKRLFDDVEWVGMDINPVGDVIGDPHRIPFEDNTFDTVLCLDTLHVSQSPIIVMNECARVLKPGGRLIVSAPNTYWDDHASLWNITGRGMDYLVAATRKLEMDTLVVEGKLFSHEWAEEFGRFHDDVRGWLGRMDNDYPQITFCIAIKKEE